MQDHIKSHAHKLKFMSFAVRRHIHLLLIGKKKKHTAEKCLLDTFFQFHCFLLCHRDILFPLLVKNWKTTGRLWILLIFISKWSLLESKRKGESVYESLRSLLDNNLVFSLSPKGFVFVITFEIKVMYFTTYSGDPTCTSLTSTLRLNEFEYTASTVATKYTAQKR